MFVLLFTRSFPAGLTGKWEGVIYKRCFYTQTLKTTCQVVKNMLWLSGPAVMLLRAAACSLMEFLRAAWPLLFLHSHCSKAAVLTPAAPDLFGLRICILIKQSLHLAEKQIRILSHVSCSCGSLTAQLAVSVGPSFTGRLLHVWTCWFWTFSGTLYFRGPALQWSSKPRPWWHPHHILHVEWDAAFSSFFLQAKLDFSSKSSR